MTQEDKELLLKDLCARLPYKVMCKVSFDEEDVHIEPLESVRPFMSFNQITTSGSVVSIDCVKPYLRPMSSMTEEEKEEFHKLKQFSVTVVMPNGVSLLKPTYIVDLEEDGDGLNHLYDWLNAHHFDYRGLIEMGLALEAPKEMYKF